MLLAVASASLGILALSAAVAGFLRVKCNLAERAALLAAALLLIKPGLQGDTIGIGLVLAVFVWQWHKIRGLPRPQLRGN